MDVNDLVQRPGSPAGSDSPLSDAGDPENILSNINDALDEIKAAGTFASYAQLRLPNPADTFSLFVHGVGDISVPLQEEQARQLIAQSRQAPYGKGSETIVDTSVRNTWELDASQFEFRNPAWSRFLDKCIGQVALSLGISSPITAELYKMLIYEKGAMFKSHTDTEKIPGMFGTMVICLPSPHEGGDLVVKHRGPTKTYKTSTSQPSLLCWYSDVHHEVLPVTSGYRWVLTYNLAIPPGQERPSAALIRSETRELRHALRRWLAHEARGDKADGPDTHHLYYLLAHEYTEASIAFRALKTTDLARVQCLRDLSTELDFDVFVAVLEKEEECEPDSVSYDPYEDDMSGGWHELVEVFETSVTIKKLVDLDGNQLRSGMKIDEADIENNMIQGCDPFEDAKDRTEEYEGYVGNEGPSATHWYRTSVAVLIPHSSTDKYLTKSLSPSSAQSLLPKYTARCPDPNSDPKSWLSAREVMRQLAKTAWAPNTDPKSWQYGPCKPNQGIVKDVLQTAFVLRDYELFNNVITWAGTQGVGSDSFSLIHTATVMNILDFGQVKQSLFDNLSKRQPEDLAACLVCLRPLDAESNAELETLNIELVDQFLNKLEQDSKSHRLRDEDGHAIITLVFSRSKDYDLFKTRVLPIIEASTSSTPFALAAILELISLGGTFPQPESLDLCRQLAGPAISAMEITTLRTPEGLKAEQPRSSSYGALRPATPAQPSHTIHWNIPSGVFEACLTHGWDDLLMTLSLKIAAQAPSIPPAEFPHLWIPFLESLLKALPDSPSPRYKHLVLALLESYLTRWVGPQQTQPSEPDLSLPEVHCLKYTWTPCVDCPRLNAFLTSRVERVARFQVGKDRKRHMHQVLDQLTRGRVVPYGVTRGTDPSARPETFVANHS